MLRLANIVVVLVVALLPVLAGCVTTPLPVPPNIEPVVEPEAIIIEPHDGGTLITGGEGAIGPAGSEIRISFGGEPYDGAPPEREQLLAGEDGSFQTWLMGVPADPFYIEYIFEDEDRFVMAISDVNGDGLAEEVAAGPDRDDDGSPDRIDCAPDDDTITGQRCP